MKQLFIVVLFVGLGIFLSMGCVEKHTFDAPNYKYHHYKEQIISFYLNSKGDEITFIGKQYHYNFNKNTKEFIEFFKNRDFLKLKQKNLSKIGTTIYEKNRVHSNFLAIFTNENLTEIQISWLMSHHYIKGRGSNPSYIKVYHIEGKRYLSNSNVNIKVKKLKHIIDLDIKEETL